MGHAAFTRLALLFLLCAALAGCGGSDGNKPAPVDLQAPADADSLAALPALPAATAKPKRVSETSYNALGEADVYDSLNVTFDEFGVQFDPDNFSYVIFSVTPGERVPARLDISGSIYDLFVALADYDAGCWRFLRGDGLHQTTLLTLGDGITPPPGSISDGGAFYVLLVKDGSYWAEGIEARLYMKDTSGDNEPPTWVEGEGVKEALLPGYGVDIYWNEAQDPSGIAYYALYEAPVLWGLDWELPLLLIPGDTPELYFGWFFSEGYTHLAAVRAIDGAGNITPNTNSIEFAPEDTEEPNQQVGFTAPGDKLVATWSDPEIDLGFDIISANGDEGDAFFGNDLAGRSFIVGSENIAAGTAEEWVRLKSSAPGGRYLVAIQGWYDNDQTFETLHLALYRADGSLRTDFGDFEMGGNLGEERDVAELLCVLAP